MAKRAGAAPEIDTRDPDLPSILAVVVTHNGRRWLSECLAALSAQSYPLLDVLVVDDATFDSRERPQIRRIAKRHLQKRRWGYLRAPRPLGFGGAINWAMSRVRTDAALLLFIHDDAALEPRSVEHMAARLMADDNTAIVGPKIVAWDDPQHLEEVGMLTDRFGYPYKGLEEGEIDLGQHDTMNEVFYVTSTCMLVRHSVFKELKGWDARMRAFSEDLDLCWRARIAGHLVRVEPRAKAKHAIALATGLRPSPFQPARYFIRRNRMRTLFKNASTIRLLGIIPAFILLSFAEMVGFIILRQPREIAALARALVWNVGTFPQTLTERTKVQRRRKVSDLKLSRLTVSQAKRVRFYISHQRDRLEETWGRRAELLAQRTSQARLLGMQLRGILGVAVFVTLLALLLGFRGVWWSPPAAVGELLPFPDSATGMWRAMLAPWRGTGLGQPGPTSPALGILGVFPLITLGGAGAAQKLLIAALGVIAFTGAYRSVADLVDRTGRIAAGAAYLFGPVGYAGLRSGSLAALVFGAAAPWVLLSMVRAAGWVRPASWNAQRAVARIALGAGISAAFVPGSLIFYAVTAVLLSAARSVFVKGQKVVSSAGVSMLGLLLGWALLLPWSAGWLGASGVLTRMRGDRWESFAAGFSDHGFLSTILGQTPEGLVFVGLALTLLGAVAVAIAEGQRRKIAIALWLVVATSGLLIGLFSTGAIRPFVASPVEAGVIPTACLAALAGLAVGAFRVDLRRRGFGIVHWGSLGAVAVAAFLVVAGLGPEILGGAWEPGKGSDRADAEVVAQVGSLMEAEAQSIGQFRALWVGDGWTPPYTSGARPMGKHFVTGTRGQVLSDLFSGGDRDAMAQLDRVIHSVETGATDRGGTLLGAFNIHIVVLERSESTRPWLAQRDLGLVRIEPDYYLLMNDSPLDRAGLYSGLPSYVNAIDRLDPSVVTNQREVEISQLRQARTSAFVRSDVASPGTVFLAEARNDGWKATVDGELLERSDSGWGNAFTLPEGRRGRLVVEFPRSIVAIFWLVIVGLAWIVVIGASFSRRKTPVPAPKLPRRPKRNHPPPLPKPSEGRDEKR